MECRTLRLSMVIGVGKWKDNFNCVHCFDKGPQILVVSDATKLASQTKKKALKL